MPEARQRWSQGHWHWDTDRPARRSPAKLVHSPSRGAPAQQLLRHCLTPRLKSQKARTAHVARAMHRLKPYQAFKQTGLKARLRFLCIMWHVLARSSHVNYTITTRPGSKRIRHMQECAPGVHVDCFAGNILF